MTEQAVSQRCGPFPSSAVRARGGGVVLLLFLALAGAGCTGADSGVDRQVALRAAAVERTSRPANFDAVKVEVEVGRAEGDAPELFGLLYDGVRLASGESIFLDSRLQRLVLLDAEGKVIHLSGGPGQGPGEFREFRSIRSLGDGSALVFDRGNRRASTYRVQGDSLALVHERTLPGLVDDVCMLGGELFLLAMRNNRLVEVLDQQGELIRAFGGLPTVEGFEGRNHEVAVATMAGGMLLCVEEPRMIVVASRFRPLVQTFSPGGEPLWDTALSSHKALWVVPSGRGFTFATEDATGEHHQAFRLHRAGDQLVLQMGIHDWLSTAPGAREVDTRLLDLATGREMGRTLTLPIMGRAEGEHGLLMSNDPYPRVALLPRWRIDEVLDAARN